MIPIISLFVAAALIITALAVLPSIAIHNNYMQANAKCARLPNGHDFPGQGREHESENGNAPCPPGH